MSFSCLLKDCWSKGKASLLILVGLPLGLADRLRFLEFDTVSVDATPLRGREEALHVGH